MTQRLVVYGIPGGQTVTCLLLKSDLAFPLKDLVEGTPFVVPS